MRPDSEWARLAGAVALAAGFFVLWSLVVGVPLERLSDAVWGLR